jgi:hypothetical protein
MKTIEIAGRLLEDADSLKERIHIKEMALQRAISGGMPKPIYIGKKRWFDRHRVDNWLLTRHK